MAVGVCRESVECGVLLVVGGSSATKYEYGLSGRLPMIYSCIEILVSACVEGAHTDANGATKNYLVYKV